MVTVANCAYLGFLLAAPAACAQASDPSSAKVTYAPTPGAWGDDAASHAWEMSTIAGRLENRLDSKSAKVGDRVVLKTTEKVQTSDGTVIPAGSRLVGRVTEVQAHGEVHDQTHAASRIGIAFDHVEVKGGASIAIYTMIRGLTPPPDLAGDEPVSAGRSGSRMGASGGSSGGLTGSTPDAAGSAMQGAEGMAGGVADRTAATADSAAAGIVDSAASSAVQRAGHGDPNVSTGAHALAAARAKPRPTGIPGVMLAGSSAASGLLSAVGGNVELESGTQVQLGIVADR